MPPLVRKTGSHWRKGNKGHTHVAIFGKFNLSKALLDNFFSDFMLFLSFVQKVKFYHYLYIFLLHIHCNSITWQRASGLPPGKEDESSRLRPISSPSVDFSAVKEGNHDHFIGRLQRLNDIIQDTSRGYWAKFLICNNCDSVTLQAKKIVNMQR